MLEFGCCERLQPWRRPAQLLLNSWLECLQESDVDLEEYGRKEVDLQKQGLVSWVWPIPLEKGDFLEGEWSIKCLTYGPLPSDWNIDIRYRVAEVAESPKKMPGGWIEDDHYEQNEDLSAEEEVPEVLGQQNLECFGG